MDPSAAHPDDSAYLETILSPIRVCRSYRPKLGHGEDYTLEQFRNLYRADPFYTWFGLDTALMYTAHRAAGGMTSIYRQIGIGCQRLVQRIIIDQLGLTAEQSTWSYEIKRRGGKTSYRWTRASS